MAESINGANVFIREKSCLSLALALLKGESEKLAEIRTMVTDPGSKFIANKQLVTPSVAKKIGIQTKGATHWAASRVTEKIGTVIHENSSDAFHTETVVDLNNLIACKNPLCDNQKKHMLHCGHVLAFLRDMGKLECHVYVKEYVPTFMTIEAYIEAYSNVFIYPNPQHMPVPAF